MHLQGCAHHPSQKYCMRCSIFESSFFLTFQDMSSYQRFASHNELARFSSMATGRRVACGQVPRHKNKTKGSCWIQFAANLFGLYWRLVFAEPSSMVCQQIIVFLIQGAAVTGAALVAAWGPHLCIRIFFLSMRFQVVVRAGHEAVCACGERTHQ